ncbi:MAG: hypothetical protein R2747_15325 [Pyrinomonadaceae bacterium]
MDDNNEENRIHTAIILEGVAKLLKPTLKHGSHFFNGTFFEKVASLIKTKLIDVQILPELKSKNAALYVYPNYGVDGLEGNTIYFPTIPSMVSRSAIAHEAVHAYFDYLGKAMSNRENEEMAYFVQGFILAKDMGFRSAMKEIEELKAKVLLIGCLASESEKKVISSEEFNKKHVLDSGEKVNPFKELIAFVSRTSKDYENRYDGVQIRRRHEIWGKDNSADTGADTGIYWV